MTTNKKVIFLILGTSIIIFIIFRLGLFRNSQNDFFQVLNKILIGNDMLVSTSSDIDIDKVKINLAYSDESVFKNNHFTDNIGEEYGGPWFDVYYDNVLLGRAIHDNTNNWYTSEFIFNFYTDNKKTKFTFKTNGRDHGGEECYIWIEKMNDSLLFESYDLGGKLISKWKE